ncbi:hypothetical protein X773_21870 [Mesorhizobium sp. LSJC285A00]|nr:hypothetical protein X773_21870 [Mesorhizobium sp. LSJC285A00]
MRTETVLPLARQSMSLSAWMMFLRARSLSGGLALGAPVDVVERLDDVLAGAFLVRRRDRVLDVEEDEIGGAVGRLVDHLRAGAWNRQLAALQP